jgi:hypothetical protein
LSSASKQKWQYGLHRISVEEINLKKAKSTLGSLLSGKVSQFVSGFSSASLIGTFQYRQ